MADNSLAKAQSLGALDNNSVVKRDALNRRDRVDYFKFSLGKSGSANFKLAGLRSNADLALLDGTGKVIARSKKGGNKPEKLQRQLAAGEYYIQVKGNGGSTKYKLKSSAVVSGGGGGNPIPSPGTGTADNPIDLGTLGSTAVSRSQDSAGLRDEKALYYKFQMGQIGTVNFRMSQVTGEGSVGLYYDSNRNGKLDFEDLTVNSFVAEGSSSNNQSDTEVLPATGTYFLKANSRSLTSDVRYDLLLTPTLAPGNLPSDPGPEETTAYNLGTLNKGISFDVKDYVGTVDQKDVFRFNLGTAAKVTYLKAVPTGDEFSVYSKIVYDKNGNGLSDSSDPTIFNSNTDDASFDLQAGNYFMFVDRGPGAYSINLTAS
jgi:Bacterial pre-peptidase C-terminal domain